jgi:hypothetical protein
VEAAVERVKRGAALVGYGGLIQRLVKERTRFAGRDPTAGFLTDCAFFSRDGGLY